MVGNPTVGGIARVLFLDEVHGGETRGVKNLRGSEGIVVVELGTRERGANHRLEHQSPTNFLDDFVERKERVAQVIEHTHEQHVIELAGNLIYVIYRTLGKLNLHAQDLSGEPGLAQVTVIHIHSENPSGSAFLKFQTIEAGITAYIQNRSSGKVLGKSVVDLLPLHLRIVTQKVPRGC